ncbi:DUF3267 domain-containing protein [Chryseobacterium balustinum]|uniref:Protein of uncharacterized function (DUF3267) n=1 Tax=Chryseobacterium balustinum TaxID=246 RepID=A0AAX2IEP7_9FLAO|nr:DUF3267 domain-containing protein [Chryseobacterium balustinum]AZB28552.1 DUF3267 domain-containing protein [Chryseobacterium balustinum]SKB77153.1 Putative zincin peptidase [Chryseobacterium balustinum]SQA86617.1 Protein of uncharacterised function (DUF3267) [Chryseobacterium balustinum]
MENYTEKKLTIDLKKANIYSLKILLYSCVIFLIPYVFLWQYQFSFEHFTATFKRFIEKYTFLSGFIPLFFMVLGIVLHELIHGLTFLPFCKNGFKSIKFGFLKQYFTPYCHCKEPLKLKYYRIGVLMPAIILGFLPSVWAIAIGNFYLLCFGIFFIMGAAGDFMILMTLKNENPEDLVLDHPSEAGCFVYTAKV